MFPSVSTFPYFVSQVKSVYNFPTLTAFYCDICLNHWAITGAWHLGKCFKVASQSNARELQSYGGFCERGCEYCLLVCMAERVFRNQHRQTGEKVGSSILRFFRRYMVFCWGIRTYPGEALIRAISPQTCRIAIKSNNQPGMISEVTQKWPDPAPRMAPGAIQKRCIKNDLVEPQIWPRSDPKSDPDGKKWLDPALGKTPRLTPRVAKKTTDLQ